MPGEMVGEGREAEVFAYGDGLVLKLWRDPLHAHRAAAEAAALQAVAGTRCRAPTPAHTVDVEGRPGLVLERVKGQSLLTLAAQPPFPVRRVAQAMADQHAEMHAIVAPADLPDLREHLRDQIETAAMLEEAPNQGSRREVLAMLDALPDGDRLCHGDLHPGNMLAPIAAPVIIDWPDAARGDPLADLARTDVLVRFSPLPPGTPRRDRLLATLGRRVLLGRYLSISRRRRRLGPGEVRQLDQWRVVRAAARLAEPVPASEHRALLVFIRSQL